MKAGCVSQYGTLGRARTGAVVSSMMLLAAAVSAASNASLSVNLQPDVTQTEIQHALDTLPDQGGEVVLPPGTFKITSPIVLSRSHQTLRGAGVTTILRLADGANCPVIIMGEPINQPTRTVTNLLVSSLFIDGNRCNQQRELWRESGEGSEIRNNGITVQRVSDSVVEQVTTARCRSGGLVTTLGVERLTVRGLESFDNEFDGLACYATTNSLFTDLNLHDNPGAGISLDLEFNHNVISNAVLAGNDLGIFMRHSRDNQFLNVSIQKSRNHGVFMAQAEQELSACTNNSFADLQATNCGGAAFRVNDATCRDNKIISAKFDENQHGGLSLAHPELIELR